MGEIREATPETSKNCDLQLGAGPCIAGLLREEAEKVGEEYIAAASVLAACYRRLRALAVLHRGHKCASDTPLDWGNSRNEKLNIPTFQLASHETKSDPRNRQVTAETVSINQPMSIKAGIASDIEAEKERFLAKGIEL